MALFTMGEIREILCDLSCTFLYAEKTPDVEEISTDSRVKMNRGLFIALDGEKFDAHNFIPSAVENGAVLVCADRKKADKIPFGVPAILTDSPLRVYQKLAGAYRKRFPDLKVISLTGSCGKTSTKEALRAIFVQAFGAEHVLATEGNTNNQIGVPQNLFRLRPEHKIAVIEMGTNHFGEILPLAETACPEAALVVSIGSCHLEFLKDFKGVATEKSNIFHTLSEKSPAVIPFSCHAKEVLQNAAEKHTSRILTFGEEPAADMQCTYKGGNIDGADFLLADHTDPANPQEVLVRWSVPGRHQACNAAAAAVMARAFGIPLSVIAEGLAKTTLPGMRMRKTVHEGAMWLNDAYNANPDSMRASLTWLSEFADQEKTLIVLGDMGELGDDSLKEHMKLIMFAAELFPRATIICVGRLMTQAVAVQHLISRNNRVAAFPDSESAVEPIRKLTTEGMLVFLKASRSTSLEKIEPPVQTGA